MARTERFRSNIFGCNSPAVTTVAALLFLLVLALATPPAQAQTYTVLYNFTGASDGRFPQGGVLRGSDGSLYGTTSGGLYSYYWCTEAGSGGCGTVFKLTQTQSGWNLTTLYSFRGGNDGNAPGRITFGPDGNLYGSTLWGGGGPCPNSGCGTVFELTPQPGSWTESVLHRFQGAPDGEEPNGVPVFDAAGNLYGTTSGGGDYICGEGWTCGAAYKLSYFDGSWNEFIIWNFGGTEDDGYFPSNVVIDAGRNLYGTTSAGGYFVDGPPEVQTGSGIAFQLVPAGNSRAEKILYDFNMLSSPDGGSPPDGGLIFDQAGNLYGTTAYGGVYQGGTAYRLSHTDNGWGVDTLFDFPGGFNSGPYGSLTMDGAGNLFGARSGLYGTVYKLAHTESGWSYSDLHDFGGGANGGSPAGYLTLDSSGNIYGATTQGGTYGYGVVWEITP